LTNRNVFVALRVGTAAANMEFGTLSSVLTADLRTGPNEKAPSEVGGACIKSVSPMSARSVLQRLAEAGLILARTERCEVAHVDLDIRKNGRGK
jgi:hypothetical protein